MFRFSFANLKKNKQKKILSGVATTSPTQQQKQQKDPMSYDYYCPICPNKPSISSCNSQTNFLKRHMIDRHLKHILYKSNNNNNDGIEGDDATNSEKQQIIKSDSPSPLPIFNLLANSYLRKNNSNNNNNNNNSYLPTHVPNDLPSGLTYMTPSSTVFLDSAIREAVMSDEDTSDEEGIKSPHRLHFPATTTTSTSTTNIERRRRVILLNDVESVSLESSFLVAVKDSIEYSRNCCCNNNNNIKTTIIVLTFRECIIDMLQSRIMEELLTKEQKNDNNKNEVTVLFIPTHSYYSLVYLTKYLSEIIASDENIIQYFTFVQQPPTIKMKNGLSNAIATTTSKNKNNLMWLSPTLKQSQHNFVDFRTLLQAMIITTGNEEEEEKHSTYKNVKELDEKAKRLMEIQRRLMLVRLREVFV